MEHLSELCRLNYSEVNIHLHHDRDNAESLEKKLLEFKNLLFKKHNLLCIDKDNNEISYGFIHGNWALDNSSPDGRWCGVNNELAVLKKTGCFADFTMPSAPDPTQTNIMNSIYYAVGDPDTSKSHDRGILAEENVADTEGLLLIQGPLGLVYRNASFRIENSELTSDNPPLPSRIDYWVNCGISIKNRPNWIFIKLHTHGTQEDTSDMLFKKGYLNRMFSHFESFYNDGSNYFLHYVTAREMTNIVHAIEHGEDSWKTELLDYRYKKTTN